MILPLGLATACLLDPSSRQRLGPCLMGSIERSGRRKPTNLPLIFI